MPLLLTSLQGLMSTKVDAELFNKLPEEMQQLLLTGILGEKSTALVDPLCSH